MPPADSHRSYRRYPQGSKGGFFALWSNKNSGQTYLSTFCSMISLKSWPEAFNHCKTPAGTDQFELESPSENDVCFCVPPAVRRGIVRCSLSGCGERAEIQLGCAGATISNRRRRCASSARPMQQVVESPPLSIEDSSQNRAVPFPLVLLPKSRFFVAGEAALELRN